MRKDRAKRLAATMQKDAPPNVYFNGVHLGRNRWAVARQVESRPGYFEAREIIQT